jgi:hypothetical protein
MPKPKTDSGSTTVYPIEGLYLQGVRHLPTVTDDEAAARLVATGAFGLEAPVAGEAPVEVAELADDARAVLDFYSPFVGDPGSEIFTPAADGTIIPNDLTPEA